MVLYELVAGRAPFAGEHEAAITYAIVNEEPQPLARYATNVPDKIEQIIRKCLAKRREERYQSCADLVADLRLEQRTSAPIPAAAPRSGRGRGIAISTIVLDAGAAIKSEADRIGTDPEGLIEMLNAGQEL